MTGRIATHIFVESGPNWTTLMYSRITLNFSRIGQSTGASTFI